MSTKFDGYDAVIIGTGFGGSACAYALSDAGLNVLLLERGDWVKRDAVDWDQRAILIAKRYQGPSVLCVKQYGDADFLPVPENEVVGGMSVFYGGASLRLREQDFGRWPLAYTDLAPYYARAESLLEVHGETGRDPFEPPGIEGYPFAPIALTSPAQRIWDAGQTLGYRPFRIPLAINFSNSERTLCIQCLTCDGFPCQIEAKNDLTMTLLRRAQELGAKIAAGVRVDRLVEANGRVRAVACVDAAARESFEVTAPIVILAAGSLQSPAILQRSELDRYPVSDLIGRFLMRHCNSVVAGIFPFRTNREGVFHKQVCFTDFYEGVRDRYGTAMGVIQDIFTPARPVLKHFAPFGAKHITALFNPLMQNLLCIAEDEPQYENRVVLSGAKDEFGVPLTQVAHQYSAADIERRDFLVGKAKGVLRKAGAFFSHAHRIDSFSHAVGTTRMGADADTSVLDLDCRFRGIDNLFVTDGSVFPSSGGVNPSLTIAANALRVADRIVQQFGDL